MSATVGAGGSRCEPRCPPPENTKAGFEPAFVFFGMTGMPTVCGESPQKGVVANEPDSDS